jgi:hypothetical protein
MLHKSLAAVSSAGCSLPRSCTTINIVHADEKIFKQREGQVSVSNVKDVIVHAQLKYLPYIVVSEQQRKDNHSHFALEKQTCKIFALKNLNRVTARAAKSAHTAQFMEKCAINTEQPDVFCFLHDPFDRLKITVDL